MEETGVLEMELVDHVFSTKFRHHKEDILDMMEQFGLIVKFTKSPGNEIYFVPCQLQTPPDDLCKIEPLLSELCPLYLRFSGSFVPYGFFSQLVSRCVSWCSSAGYGLPNLFDGASRFLIGKEQNHQLILVCKKRFIKVTLKQIKQEDLPLDETKLQDAAIKVRSFLEDTIEALKRELSGLKNVAYELCVECPYCLEEQKICRDHSQFPCDNEYCMCLLKVTADGSFEYCGKCYACVKPKLPQLQRWFPIKGEAGMILYLLDPRTIGSLFMDTYPSHILEVQLPCKWSFTQSLPLGRLGLLGRIAMHLFTPFGPSATTKGLFTWRWGAVGR